jgi:hypothetical protein
LTKRARRRSAKAHPPPPHTHPRALHTHAPLSLSGRARRVHAPSNFIFWHLFGLWCVNAAPFLPRSILAPPRPSQPPDRRPNSLASSAADALTRGARGCAPCALRPASQPPRACACAPIDAATTAAAGDARGPMHARPRCTFYSMNGAMQYIRARPFARSLARSVWPATRHTRRARRCRQGLFTPRGAHPGCAAAASPAAWFSE